MPAYWGVEFLMTKDELNTAISIKRGLDELVDWTADANWPTLLRELPHVAVIAANNEWTCGYDFRDKPYGFDWEGKAHHSTPGEAVALCWLKWKEKIERVQENASPAKVKPHG